MDPWVERPTIDLDVSLAPSHRFAAIGDEPLAAARDLLAAVMAEVPPRALPLADALRLRTGGHFQREIAAIARRAGVSWRAVMLANVSYDLVLSAVGCSTVALPTPDGPVVARNMDWWPEALLARGSYLIRNLRDNQLDIALGGWPGAVGAVTGLSARGFAVVLNAVSGPEKRSRLGYPVMLHLRRVLEDATDFDHALKLISRQRLCVPCLVTLVGTRNDQRVVIERSPTRHALRWPEGDRPLVTTNDYRKLFAPGTRGEHEMYESTCGRYDALCRFFANHDAAKDVPDEVLLDVLSNEQVMQTITAQHILIRPAQQSMRVFVPRHLLTAPAPLP